MSLCDVEKARIAAQQRLVAYISLSGGEACEFECVITEGDPAKQILDLAGALPQDFIVLGPPSRSMVSRLLSGSVVHRVVSEARCPVITITPNTSDVREMAGESFHSEQNLTHS